MVKKTVVLDSDKACLLLGLEGGYKSFPLLCPGFVH